MEPSQAFGSLSRQLMDLTHKTKIHKQTMAILQEEAQRNPNIEHAISAYKKAEQEAEKIVPKPKYSFLDLEKIRRDHESKRINRKIK